MPARTAAASTATGLGETSGPHLLLTQAKGSAAYPERCPQLSWRCPGLGWQWGAAGSQVSGTRRAPGGPAATYLGSKWWEQGSESLRNEARVP